MDSHADTFVAGKNCVPMNYTERTCDVQPYSDDYDPVKNIPIITAATGYTSAHGMNYILVFPEAIYMPTLEHSLCNPNQLRHFGTIVQDNPYADTPMGITTADHSFTACFQSKGTDISLQTWAPSQADLQRYPHIILSSSQLWNPRAIKFPGISMLEKEEIEVRNVRAVKIENFEEECIHEKDMLFDISDLRRSIISSARVTEGDLYSRRVQASRRVQDQGLLSVSDPVHDTTAPPDGTPPVFPGPLEEHDIQPPRTFLSSDRHSKTTPEDLSERWGLSIAQSMLTLKATTRMLV
jgi:hypothetical protein